MAWQFRLLYFYSFTGHLRNPWLALTEPLSSVEPWLKTTRLQRQSFIETVSILEASFTFVFKLQKCLKRNAKRNYQPQRSRPFSLSAPLSDYSRCMLQPAQRFNSAQRTRLQITGF